jgi:hypothetical protein
MTASRTDRLTSILACAAVAIVVGFVACPGRHGSGGSAPALVSTAVTPTNPTIALGTTRQLIATGTYTDGRPWI